MGIRTPANTRIPRLPFGTRSEWRTHGRLERIAVQVQSTPRELGAPVFGLPKRDGLPCTSFPGTVRTPVLAWPLISHFPQPPRPSTTPVSRWSCYLVSEACDATWERW